MLGLADTSLGDVWISNPEAFMDRDTLNFNPGEGEGGVNVKFDITCRGCKDLEGDGPPIIEPPVRPCNSCVGAAAVDTATAAPHSYD